MDKQLVGDFIGLSLGSMLLNKMTHNLHVPITVFKHVQSHCLKQL